MSEQVPSHHPPAFQWPQEITDIGAQEGSAATTSNVPLVDPETPSLNLETTPNNPELNHTFESAPPHVEDYNLQGPDHDFQLPLRPRNPTIQIQDAPTIIQTNGVLPSSASSSPEHFAFAIDMSDQEVENHDGGPNSFDPFDLATPLLLRRPRPQVNGYPNTAMHPPASHHQLLPFFASFSELQNNGTTNGHVLSSAFAYPQNQPAGFPSSSRPQQAFNDHLAPSLHAQTRPQLGMVPTGNAEFHSGHSHHAPRSQVASHHSSFNSILERPSQPRPQSPQSWSSQDSGESNHPPNLLYPGPRPTVTLPGMVRYANNYGAQPGIPLVGDISDPRWWNDDVGYGPRQPWMLEQVPMTNGHSMRPYVGGPPQVLQFGDGGWTSAGDRPVGGRMSVGVVPASRRRHEHYSMRTEGRPSRESGTFDSSNMGAGQPTGGRVPMLNNSSDISPHTTRPAVRRVVIPPRETETTSSRGIEDIGRSMPPRRDALSAPSGVSLGSSSTQQVAQPNDMQASPSVGLSLTTQAITTPIEDGERREVTGEISSVPSPALVDQNHTTVAGVTGVTGGEQIVNESASVASLLAAPSSEVHPEPAAQFPLAPFTFAMTIPSTRATNGSSWETLASPEESPVPQPTQEELITQELHISTPTQSSLQNQTSAHASQISPHNPAPPQSSPQNPTASPEPSPQTALLPTLLLVDSDSDSDSEPERRRDSRWRNCLEDCLEDLALILLLALIILLLFVFIVHFTFA